LGSCAGLQYLDVSFGTEVRKRDPRELERRVGEDADACAACAQLP